MSYCRWSTDNFRSDVYVYLSPDGYVTHLASSRKIGIIVGDAPWELLISNSWFKHLVFRIWDFMADLNHKLAIRVKIKLPFAGESFLDGTASSCADRLINLRRIGYAVPDEAIYRLIDEDDDE